VVFDYSMGPIGFSSALSMKRYTLLVLDVEDGHNALVYRFVDRSDLQFSSGDLMEGLELSTSCG
jgi:hypothetical protein